MTFDTWTTAAVGVELAHTLVPGRVQQVLQVDEDSLAFEVYAGGQRRYLLVSAQRQAPRVHLLAAKPRRGVDTASPLLQLLRKFVRGATLGAVVQPPWERVLWLVFDHPEHGRSALVAELIGRRANGLLLRPAQAASGSASRERPVDPPAGEWRILECVHRTRPQEQGSPAPGDRILLPGRPYSPPPVPAGYPPDELTEGRLRLLLEEMGTQTPLWQVLVQGLRGISPLLAREMVWRAYGDAQAIAGDRLPLQPLLDTVAGFVTMLSASAWQPCTVVEGETVVAFAPYPLLHRGGPGQRLLRPAVGISAAVEQFYDQALHRRGDAYAAARQHPANQIARAQAKLTRRREAIAGEVRSAEEIEALRAAGEWILALASQITPRQTELRLPAEAGPRSIALDPALSPAQNAAAYFKRYRRAQRAAQAAAERLAEVDGELAYLAQLATDLALATDRNEIDAVVAALVEARVGRPRKASPARGRAGPGSGDQVGGPRRFTSAEGYTILVGRNARQNEQVTFDLARPDDLWLHARDWPGAHVVIRCGGQPVSEATLAQAAGLAAYYSGAQREAAVDVIAVERRRVRRAPHKRPGMVLVDGGQVLRVRPDPSLAAG